MNTKGMKFLAVLAVLAMAFAACAVLTSVETDDAAAAATASPLNDGAIKTGTTMTVGNMSLELYLQQTMSVVKSSNTLTIYGVDKIGPNTAENKWSGAYTLWEGTHIKTISFAVTALNGVTPAASEYFYIYQENNALPDSTHAKVSKIDLSKLSKTEASNNPSFEIPISDAASTVTLKLISNYGADAPTVAQAKAMADGANCVTYTLNLKVAPTTDSDALTAGFGVKKVTEGTEGATYFKYLSAAMGSVNDTVTTYATAEAAKAKTITFTLLDDMEDIAGVATAETVNNGTGNTYLDIEIDLGGHTYKNNSPTVGNSHKMKIFYPRTGEIWNVNNGKIVSDRDASDFTTAGDERAFNLFESYGNLTLGASGKPLEIDISKVKVYVAQNNVKMAIAIWAMAGKVTVTDYVTINAGNHVAAMACVGSSTHGANAGASQKGQTTNSGISNLTYADKASEITINGATINGTILASYRAAGLTLADNIVIGTEIILDGTILNGSIVQNYKYLAGKTGTTTPGTNTTQLTKITVKNLVVEDGKKVTIGDGTTADMIVNVENTGKITNNGTIAVKKAILQFGANNAAASKSISEYGLQGAGKVTVDKDSELIVNEGTAGEGNQHIWAIGSNEITLSAGAKYYASSDDTTSEFWGIVGPVANVSTDANTIHSSNKASVDGFIFGLGTAATISIKANYSTFPVLTGATYTFTGPVSWGYCNDDGFDWFDRYDNVVINSGTVTLTQATVVKEHVVMDMKAGATLAPSNGAKALTVTGTLNLYESAQYYSGITTATAKNVKIVGDGTTTPEEVKVKETGTTIDSSTFSGETADVIVTSTANIVSATVPANKTVIINSAPANNATLNVAAENSTITLNLVANTNTFTVNTGAGVIKATNLTGIFTFTKGSIVVEAKDWTGGDMELSNGDVLKIKGTVNPTGGTVNITVASGTATMIVESGTDKTLTINEGKTLVVGTGITVQIDGTVSGLGTLSAAGKVVINGKLDANLTASSTGDIDIYGEVTSGKVITNTNAKVIAHEKSKINGVKVTVLAKLEGKDAKGGSWKYTNGNTLTISGYTGNYNFRVTDNAGTPAVLANTLQTIVLEGESKITYNAPNASLVGALFGNYATPGALTIKTVQGSGSLTVNVNLSSIKTAGISFVVFSGDVVKLNGVDLSINVTGSNAEWDSDRIEAISVVGIYAYKEGAGVTTGTSFEMYDADLDMDILSSYEIAGVCGLYVNTCNTTPLVHTYAAGPITMTSSDDVSITTAGIALYGGAMTVQGTNVTADGKKFGMIVTTMEITNASDIETSSGLIASGNISIAQNSTLEVTDFTYKSGTLTNNGNVITNGNAVMIGNIDNKASFINNGVMGIYGSFINSNGTFTNEGTFKVLDKKFKTYAEASPFTDALAITGDSAPSSDTYVKVEGIAITGIEPNADGSAAVKATLSFAPVITLKTGTGIFEGTLTPTQIDGSYTLYLTNGTATVTIVYDATKTAATDSDTIGSRYTVSVTGQVETNDAVYFLEANRTKVGDVPGATVTDKIKLDAAHVINTTEADFDITDGTFVNEGTAVISHSLDAAIITDGVFVGDLTTEIPVVTISGGFSGDLTANGTGKVTVGDFIGDITAKGEVEVTALKTMAGDITTKGAVTVSGVLAGDITTEANVTVAGALVGDVQVTLKATKSGTLTVTGSVDGDLKYISSYKEKYADTTDTTYTSVMHIDGDMVQADSTVKTFVIAMSAGTNATTSTDGKPGCLGFGTTLEAADTNKSVELSLTEGKLLVSTLVNLPERFALVVESGATIEVAKTGGSFNVASAALKVNKDAIKNFETGSAAPVNYGKVTYIMSFDIDDGAYTIYSDVAYALTNCNEGAELTLGSAANINANVSVKKGVSIIVDGVKLDFKTFGLKMDEGAKLILKGAGNLVFGITDKIVDDPDKENEYFTINGTIVYDDNAVELNGVRFTAASTFAGKAATSTEASKINMTLTYNEGTVSVEDGTATGTITLSNDAYKLLKADTTDTLVFGVFMIDEGAIFDAVAINDKFGEVTYKESTTIPLEYIVDEVKLMPTIVTVNGTLNLSGSTTIKGVYAGEGKVVLASGKTLTLAACDDKGIPGNKTVAPSIAAILMDNTDDENGFYLNLVTPVVHETLEFTSKKIKDVNVMTIKGDFAFGVISAIDGTDAYLDKVNIEDNAVIKADVVYIIDDSKAQGGLAAKIVYMKNGTTTSEYKTLTFQVTFEEEDYTVYTFFKNVDIEEISDITIAGNADNYNLSNLVPGAAKVDLSGNDVNITIAEGKTLTVNVPLIIGTPINYLGGLEGSSITGKVIITGTNYIVAYSDVDLTDAEIVQNNAGKTAAVYSSLTIEDVLYATIFAMDVDDRAAPTTGKKLVDADRTLVPEIEGYIFTTWTNLNEDKDAFIGDTNAYAGVMPMSVYVTVKFVNGITYYCNGIEFAIYDTPVKVEYNSVFTAKISDTSKYQGTPLVNGKNSLVITDDVEIVGSGVTPIPEPPAPEPVVGDSGLSLTDILLIVLVILIAIMVVILVLRLNRS